MGSSEYAANMGVAVRELPMTVSTPDLGGVERLAALPPALALERAVPVLTSLVEDPVFQSSTILPLLEGAHQAKDWYVAHRQKGEDGSYSLQIFLWPAGSHTNIHDHSSWGALRCVVGSIEEVRYERLDDGEQPNRARLREAWRRVWGTRDGVSRVLPYEGGIHRIGNPGPGMAISVHLYGPRMGDLDGRDYDPSCDYVCDRAAA